MSPVYLAAIALVIAVVIVIAVVGSKKHAKTPSQAQQLFDDEAADDEDQQRQNDLSADGGAEVDQLRHPYIDCSRIHIFSSCSFHRCVDRSGRRRNMI